MRRLLLSLFASISHLNLFARHRSKPKSFHLLLDKLSCFYNGLNVPTRQILDSKGAIPTKTIADAKISIREMAEYSQKWHNGTSSKARSTETFDGLAVIQARLNNLRREIKKVNEKDSIEQHVQKGRIRRGTSNIIKEIQASTDASIRNQGASIKTLKIQIGQMSKVLQERGIRVHTPYQAHSAEAYFLKQFPSQGDYKTTVVTIGERHKM
ncbi:hypothetical protein Tco_1338462 [Tanacetum coccineum]